MIGDELPEDDQVVSHDRSALVTDGSGSIYIDTVGGDVIIRDDGSGGLRIRNVKGRVLK